MGEVLQTSETIKLYCENYEKPDLSDETLAHYGVLGMRWGVRKDRKKSGGSIKRSKNRKAKKQVKTYKDPKEALEARDLDYMNKHKDKFSTNEINQVLSRLDTEKRLSAMSKEYGESKTKKNIKKILKSKEFKIVAGVTIGVLAIAGGRYLKSKSPELIYQYKKWKFNRKGMPNVVPMSKKSAANTVRFMDEVRKLSKEAYRRAARDIIPGGKYILNK